MGEKLWDDERRVFESVWLDLIVAEV